MSGGLSKRMQAWSRSALAAGAQRTLHLARAVVLPQRGSDCGRKAQEQRGDEEKAGGEASQRQHGLVGTRCAVDRAHMR